MQSWTPRKLRHIFSVLQLTPELVKLQGWYSKIIILWFESSLATVTITISNNSWFMPIKKGKILLKPYYKSDSHDSKFTLGRKENNDKSKFRKKQSAC